MRGTIKPDANDPATFLLWEKRTDGTCEIVDVEVANGKRRTGIGRGMVDLLLKTLFLDNEAAKSKSYRLLWAITRTSNRVAQEFYENLNFRVVAVLRCYYDKDSNAADAIMYGRDLT